MLHAATVAVGVLVLLASAWAAVVSWREAEPRAAGIFALAAVGLPAPYLVTGLVAFDGRTPVAVALLSVTLVVVAVLIIPAGRAPDLGDDKPTQRIDERDVMFSRAHLRPGTDRFEAYYAANPEHRAPDDAFRAQPGLLAPDASMYHPYAFTAADATFWSVEHLRTIVDGGLISDGRR